VRDGGPFVRFPTISIGVLDVNSAGFECHSPLAGDRDNRGLGPGQPLEQPGLDQLDVSLQLSDPGILRALLLHLGLEHSGALPHIRPARRRRPRNSAMLTRCASSKISRSSGSCARSVAKPGDGPPRAHPSTIVAPGLLLPRRPQSKVCLMYVISFTLISFALCSATDGVVPEPAARDCGQSAVSNRSSVSRSVSA
jgi:hypothetical protein